MSSSSATAGRDAIRRLLPFAIAACLAGLAIDAHAQADSPTTPLSRAAGLCGELDNAYGPYDFRTDKDKLPIVERFHFTPPVEMLQHGNTGKLGSDIDYTLRAFPNHHRALYSMMRLGERTPGARPLGAHYPVECYFERAIRFRPDDAQVHALYAFYLLKSKRTQEARRQLDRAAKLEPDDPHTLYNIGLGYADLKEYDKSLAFAHQAYAKGVRVDGLRERLRAVGKWREPRN